MDLRGDRFVEHSGTATWTRPIEGFNALRTILFQAAFDAVDRDAEDAHDVRQSAGTLIDQLRREHAKRSVIVFIMSEDRADAQEVRPLAVLPDDADEVINGSGTVWNEGQ